MKRDGRLIKYKYNEYFLSTLAMSGCASIAAIVDRIMVGNLLTANDLNATNLVGPLIYVLNMIFGLFIYGGNTLAVTYKGKRDHESANKCFTIAIIGGAVFMAVFAAAGLIFRVPLSNRLCIGKEELFKPVSEYLVPTLFLGIFMILLNGTSAFVRVDGLRKLAIALPIVSNAINLTLDYVFMGVFKTGIAGAGWATDIGFGLALFLLIPYFRSEKRTVFFTRIGFKDLRLMFDSFHLGLATALMYLCMFLKTFFLNSLIILKLGTIGGQVIVVCAGVMSVANIFFTGTAQTVLPINGALYAVQDCNGIRQLFKTAMITMEVICFTIMAVFMIFPLQAGAAFNVTSPEAQALLPGAISMFCLCIPPTGMLFILRSHYQSTGHRNAATVLTVLEGTVFFIPVLLIFSKTNPGLMWLTHVISAVMAIAVILLVMGAEARRKGLSSVLLLPKQTEVNTFDFSIENKVEAAVEASSKMIELCEKNGIDNKVANIIGVSVEELCVNTARYASGPRSDVIDIFLRIMPEAVVLTVRDNGGIFNPTEFIDNSGKMITGLKLVRSISSKIEYNRVVGFNNTIVTVNRSVYETKRS